MSTLVEMIEALQSQAIEQIHVATTNSETGKQALIDALRARFASILAAAREQAEELAAMKEPMGCTHPKAFTRKVTVPHNTVTVTYSDCSLCADLRKIAHICASMCVVEEDVEKATETIIRTFRKQKAEVKAQ